MPWLIALVPIIAAAQQAPDHAVVDHRLQPPFPSLRACLDFAGGGSAESPAGPAARLICRELERVWQDPATAKPAADNPLRIDFGAPRLATGREPAQGAVDGALLARILTVPDLLPPRLDAGLVLENLLVTGTLELTEASIDLPVVVRRARFRPAATTMVTDHLAPIAIRLDRAHFADAFEIRESDLAGHLLIDDSTFAGGLALADVVVSSRADLGSPLAEGQLGRSATLHVRHSTFEADLSLSNVAIFSPPVRRDWGWEVGSAAIFDGVAVAPRLEMQGLYTEGDFEIARSELGAVSLQDFQFAGQFQLKNNSLTRMEIADGDFRAAPFIDQNRALQSVAIHSIGIHPRSASVPVFRANQIGGSFMWSPSGFGAEVRRIDLTYNRVDGRASIFPPDGSTVEIDLSNVQMPSRLELGRSLWWYRNDEDRDALYHAGEGIDQFCGAIDDRRSGRLINLTNASINILAWNFPIDCGVRWDGAGLSYAYWGDPDLKSGDAKQRRKDDDFINALKHWRFAMQQENSETLDYMSTYLDLRGRFGDSRDLQKDAKEVNYRPTGLLDLDWVVYWLLWPTGFGVKPELALLWLFIGWVLGGVFYTIYRWRSRAGGWPPPAAPGLQEAPAPYVAAADQGRITPATLEITEQPSLVAGFMQYQRDRRPADFSIWAFSADAMLPVINLHAYTEYYPKSRGARFVSFAQHIVGWWMLSIFLASATIL